MTKYSKLASHVDQKISEEANSPSKQLTTSAILDHYLARNAITSGALDDCRRLSTLNSAYLEQVEAELGTGK